MSLVERLRQGAGHEPADVMAAERAMDEAAAEIERLRAALERAQTGLRQKDWCTEPQAQWTIRRTALLLGWSDEWSA